MPKEKDSEERMHETLFQSMQQQPISEEEADELRERHEGFERIGSAEERFKARREEEEKEKERQ
jgi:hypothetical protein